MGLRINPDMTQAVLTALERLRAQENTALEQVASGRRINRLADDPAASAALVQSQSQIKKTDQFLKNLTSLRAQLQSGDSALNSVVAVLTRAITMGIQGANGTLSPEDRKAIAQEVSGIQEQVLGLANSAFSGSYLFAGTAVTVPPFALDSSQPSGVRYDGNTGANSVEVAEGQLVRLQLPGSQIFTAPAADVFQAMNGLVAALESGAGIDTAVSALQNAFQHVNQVRAFYGITMARLDGTEKILNQEKLDLTQSETDLTGADLAQVLTDLKQIETARNAVLGAGSKILQLTLIDFLK